jgi:hypothetical protein
MKNLLAFVFALFTNLIVAQTTVFYVDVSGDVNRISLTERIQLDLSKNDDIIYFISNDNSPLIGKSAYKLNQDLSELTTIRPSSPISFKEVDTLLCLLQDVTMPLELCFYLDNQYALNEGIQNLIGRLLLSSGWQNRNGIKPNVKVKIYIQNWHELTENQLNKLSKNGTYEVIKY